VTGQVVFGPFIRPQHYLQEELGSSSSFAVDDDGVDLRFGGFFTTRFVALPCVVHVFRGRLGFSLALDVFNPVVFFLHL
jgi:hypothetical protein